MIVTNPVYPLARARRSDMPGKYPGCLLKTQIYISVLTSPPNPGVESGTTSPLRKPQLAQVTVIPTDYILILIALSLEISQQTRKVAVVLTNLSRVSYYTDINLN